MDLLAGEQFELLGPKLQRDHVIFDLQLSLGPGRL